MVNKSILTFDELTYLVRHIPSDRWRHDFHSTKETLTFAMPMDNLTFYLCGDNEGRVTGKGDVRLDNVSVQLIKIGRENVNLAAYTGEKRVRDLFYDIRERVNEYNNFGSTQSARQQLRSFRVNSDLIAKILPKK